MAKKKRNAKKPKGEFGGQLPFDRRAMEQAMQHFAEQLFGGEGSPLGRALELVHEAYEQRDPRRREALARKAIEVCADCADAYSLLAEDARSVQEAVEQYEEAVAAGRRAIGEKTFRRLVGQFWGHLETRPYMRARYGLAHALWEAGRHEDAVAHYADMLRLNPNDNQGIRYVLSDCLLALERHEEVERLLDEYPQDDSAGWAYTRALLEFRKGGDSAAARDALAVAAETNAYVPEYLTGNRAVPEDTPEYVEHGAEDEAINYVASQLRHWRNTPGAVSWLRKTLRVAPPEQPPRPPVSWRRVKPRLASLSQEEEEVWQVDIHRARHLLSETGDSAQPWVVLVVNADEHRLLAVHAETDRPTQAVAWTHLIAAMLEGQDEPHRPGRVEVRLKTFSNAWRGKLQQIGVECIAVDELPAVGEVLQQMEALSVFGGPAEQRRASNQAGSFDPEDVPQYVDAIWQVDARRLPAWVDAEGEAMRPWSIIAVDTSGGLVLAQDLSLETPTEESLWNVVVGAMARPMAGDPHRPGTVQFRSPDYASWLRARLNALDVRCEVVEELEAADAVFEGLGEHLSEGLGLRPLIDVPGMTPEQIGSFYAAAADFYRRAPWRMIPGDAMIRIECDKYTNGTWYAAIMGQSGMTLGLALYEDLDVLESLMREDISEEEHSRRVSALSVTFDEEFAAPARDLDAAEKYGWPVAGPEAYPLVMRVNPGRSVRPPLTWELELLEGSLRAIPQFLAQDKQSQRQVVPVARGELEMELTQLQQG